MAYITMNWNYLFLTFKQYILVKRNESYFLKESTICLFSFLQCFRKYNYSYTYWYQHRTNKSVPLRFIINWNLHLKKFIRKWLIHKDTRLSIRKSFHQVQQNERCRETKFLCIRWELCVLMYYDKTLKLSANKENHVHN